MRGRKEDPCELIGLSGTAIQYYSILVLAIVCASTAVIIVLMALHTFSTGNVLRREAALVWGTNQSTNRIFEGAPLVVGGIVPHTRAVDRQDRLFHPLCRRATCVLDRALSLALPPASALPVVLLVLALAPLDRRTPALVSSGQSV